MRLIDVNEAVINFGFEYDDIAPTPEEFIAFLKRQPAVDAVAVTRCKDCRYLVNATVNANGFLICDINDMEIAPDDFCSYGEPKEVR